MARPSSALTKRGLLATAYVILGSALLVSRLKGLGHSFWHDEVVTVADFVRGGPDAILTGYYIPNNHELFSLLAWATSTVAGGSEIVMRLWSVVPFLVGVTLVTAWLHLRLNPTSAVLFLFLATVSPLLLDLSRQARGYGLAFLAMSVIIVAALEANGSARTWTIVAFCIAGFVGSATLPNFVVAFLATGGVLLFDARLRRRLAVGLCAALLMIGVFYAPHAGDLLDSSRQTFGVKIHTAWVLTAPIDQILLPGLVWIDDKAASPGFAWLPVTLALLIPISASPFLRDSRSALIIISGVVATVGIIWLTRTFVIPRFMSYLLVPLLMLLASGIASILARLNKHPPLVRTVAALTILVLLGAGFFWQARRITTLPREAHEDAAVLIRSEAPPSTRVVAYTYRSRDLAFYLERPVVTHPTTMAASDYCSRPLPLALVVQGRTVPTGFPCRDRTGTRHYRFDQYARGGEMNVWIIPPPPAS